MKEEEEEQHVLLGDLLLSVVINYVIEELWIPNKSRLAYYSCQKQLLRWPLMLNRFISPNQSISS